MKFIRNIIAERTNMNDVGPESGPETGVKGGQDADTDLRQVFAAMQADDPVENDTDRSDLLAEANFASDWSDDDIHGQPDTLAAPEMFEDTGGIDDVGPNATPIETNSEAVMRTIYHPGPPLSEAQVAKLDRAEASTAPEQERPISAFQKIMQREDASRSRDPEPTTPVARSAPTIPAPSDAGPTRKKAGRVKTRLLGFGNDFGREPDPFATGETAAPAPQIKFPVGWIVVVSGPGRGTAFTLFDGVSQIGRGEDQAVRLDFGDTSISRSNHAAIAYDPEQQNFYLGHGGKANLVRLNGNPVLSTEPLRDGAEIRLGETTLRFVGLCGPAFDWGKTAVDKGGDESDDEGGNARFD